MTEEKTAYLLTWNPDKWNDWDLAKIAQNVADGQTYREPWRCGNKSIQPGDQVFVLKQGRHQLVGLIGSGIAISHSYPNPNAMKDNSLYVDIELDCLVDGVKEVIISRNELREIFPQQYWDAQQSGTRIKSEILLPLTELWENRAEYSLSPKLEEEEFPEGKELYKQHRTRERNRQLIRQAKAKRLGERGCLECDVCGFNFSDVYRGIGQGYIECHHTKPISELQSGETTNLKDIALVCANCHRMLHRKRPWLSISQLESLKAGQR